MSAVGPGKYLVAFDNNEMMDCPSNRLHVESRTSAIPPDVPPIQVLQRPAGAPPQAIAAAEREMDELIQAIEDSHEDDEHLPPAQDEDEDEEVDGNVGSDVQEVQPVGGAEPQQVHDPDGRMPGQLTTVATVQQELRTYSQRKEAAKEKIRQKIGEEVTIHQCNEQVVWKVVTEHHVEVERDTDDLGLIGNDLLAAVDNSTIGKIFLKLTFADWKEKVDCLNTAIEERNTENPKSQRVRSFTESEFLVCLGLLIGAPEYGIKGPSLWQNGKGEDSAWLSIMPHPNFDRFIPEYRFQHFREFFPFLFQDDTVKDIDPWWQFSGAMKEFNNNRFRLVKGAKVKAIDESMCAYRPRTTSTSGLPNISFIKRKPEPLGLYRCFDFFCFLAETNIIFIFTFLSHKVLNSRLQLVQKLVACFTWNFRGVKLECQPHNTSRSLEQLLLVPFAWPRVVSTQKMTAVIQFKGMRGLDLLRLQQHLEERESGQSFK
jgi:hypothetical protein